MTTCEDNGHDGTPQTWRKSDHTMIHGQRVAGCSTWIWGRAPWGSGSTSHIGGEPAPEFHTQGPLMAEYRYHPISNVGTSIPMTRSIRASSWSGCPFSAKGAFNNYLPIVRRQLNHLY